MSDAVFKQANKIQPAKDYPLPKPGSYYTVPTGIELYEVSIRAYGYDKTALIVKANTLLQSRPLDSRKLPEIYTDDRIWIPPEIF